MLTEPYEKSLYMRLADSDYCAGYLTECYKDSLETFLMGVRNAVNARGGMSLLAAKTKLSREHLYTLLSQSGNPRIENLSVILEALGFRLQIVSLDTKDAA